MSSSMEKEEFNIKVTSHKYMASVMGVDPTKEDGFPVFGRRFAANGTHYCFMAGRSNSVKFPFRSKKNGICIVFFPGRDKVFVKYFDSPKDALSYFNIILKRSMGPDNLIEWLRGLNYLEINCNLIDEYYISNHY